MASEFFDLLDFFGELDVSHDIDSDAVGGDCWELCEL